MWATGMQGPWDTDRYSELDLCLVFGRWANSINNVESDSLTNVTTDHLALRIKITHKLKALAEAEHGAVRNSEEQSPKANNKQYDTMRSLENVLEKVRLRTWKAL